MNSKTFYLIFSGLLITDLILLGSGGGITWRFILEPLMMVLLLLHIRYQFRGAPASKLRYLYLALGTIVLGGIFMLEGAPQYNFLVGTIFFLIANLSYTYLFYKCADLRIKPAIPFIIIASVAAMVVLFFLYEYLGNYYMVAAVYLFILLNCLQAAYLRNRMVNRISFQLVFYGMLLFFIAQVIAAFDHFIYEVVMLDGILITTFMVSQVMIMRGLLLEKREKMDYLENEEYSGEESTEVAE